MQRMERGHFDLFSRAFGLRFAANKAARMTAPPPKLSYALKQFRQLRRLLKQKIIMERMERGHFFLRHKLCTIFSPHISSFVTNLRFT